MPDLAVIRRQLPATLDHAYLNTGSYGPLSRAAAETIAEHNSRQVEVGRIGPDAFDDYATLRGDLRRRFAQLINAAPDEIALTHHTTDGMNIAVWGTVRPGDEIVTTSLEHPGGLLPVYAAARRFGASVRVVHLDETDDAASTLEKVAAALSSRTRLLVISHVSWKSGIVAPVAELAQLVHQQGGFLAVDGAQSAGAIPLDMQALGVDFYALPGQKWLCGPEGVGALYVRRERLSDLHQTYVGYPSMRDGLAHDDSGSFLAAEGAARYEVGTVYKPALVGMCAGLDWLAGLGWDWIYSRVRTMTEFCRARLAHISGVTVTTSQDFAGLTCFRIEGVEPAQAVTHLADRGVLIRSVSRPDLLRASTSFFNSEDDLERLQAGVEELCA